MRHLIARYKNYFVVGLKDRTFLVFDKPGDSAAPTGTIVELLPSEDSKKDDKESEPSASAKPTEPAPDSNDASSDPTEDGKKKDPEEQKPQNKNGDKVQKNRRKLFDEQLNEICAVAIIGDGSNTTEDIVLRCAVARNKKTMDIYTVKLAELFPTTPAQAEPIRKTNQSPSLQYLTPKRVSSFDFANIAANESSSSDANANAGSPVLISGDVAGDSYAYNMLEKGQRLLLGHTASMLTDIAVVNGGKATKPGENCFLLTCDRDEKIRISRFPESYVIEGFLLGHTTYVTGVTLVPSPSSSSSSSSLAVSCGGDRTLRLWNLTTQSEISSTSTAPTPTSEKTTSSAVTDDEEANDTEDKSEIPTAIEASCCGGYIAVIFDDSKRLSIYNITQTSNDGDSSSLELLGSVGCPSQPLSIVFHEVAQTAEVSSSINGAILTVLMKDPEYILRYDINNSKEEGVEKLAISRSENVVMKALTGLASDEKITMPNTILEKDDYGNPILQKENETRGPAASEAPWNRVERVEIAKEKLRRKKKPKLEASS